MKWFASAFLLLATVYLTLAFQTPLPQSDIGDGSAVDTTLAARIGQGAELFSRTCQRCHNPRSPAERTDREWVMIMQHMQTRANLTRVQSNLVRDFLLASNDVGLASAGIQSELITPSEVTEEMIAAGRLVYKGAGTCFACHGAGLEGGPIAPNLNDNQWKSGSGDYVSLLGTVRNGVSGTAMAAYPGGISDEQAQQVAAYIWAIVNDRAEP